jgi:hypothetical protein
VVAQVGHTTLANLAHSISKAPLDCVHAAGVGEGRRLTPRHELRWVPQVAGCVPGPMSIPANGGLILQLSSLQRRRHSTAAVAAALDRRR